MVDEELDEELDFGDCADWELALGDFYRENKKLNSKVVKLEKKLTDLTTDIEKMKQIVVTSLNNILDRKKNINMWLFDEIIKIRKTVEDLR